MRTIASSLLAAALTLGSVVPMFMFQYEDNTRLAYRWSTDQAGVIQDIQRVKRYWTFEKGQLVEKVYAETENIREVGKYATCVNSPELCKGISHR